MSRLAQCFHNGRDPDVTIHKLPALIGQHIFAIALGYEDLNDHDRLRHNSVLGVLARTLTAKRSNCAVFAGKSTLNRLEHAAKVGADPYHKIIHDTAAIERLFVTLFTAAYATPPRQIVIDLDATHDPVHGEQEGRFFHGYYDCYCYLPLYIFCGEFLLSAQLRSAKIDPAKGALTDLQRVVAQIRKKWRRVPILVRGDSGFCRDAIMKWCEREGIDYCIRIGKESAPA